MLGLIVLVSCSQQDAVRVSVRTPGQSISFHKTASAMEDFNVCIQPLEDYVLTPADFEMRHFSITRDKNTVIPTLKDIKEKHKEVHFHSLLPKLPSWMESQENADSLYRASYSRYVGRFVNSYYHEGIFIERLYIVEGSKEAEFTSASELTFIPNVQFEILPSTAIPKEVSNEKIIYITK